MELRGSTMGELLYLQFGSRRTLSVSLSTASVVLVGRDIYRLLHCHPDSRREVSHRHPFQLPILYMGKLRHRNL